MPNMQDIMKMPPGNIVSFDVSISIGSLAGVFLSIVILSQLRPNIRVSSSAILQIIGILLT